MNIKHLKVSTQLIIGFIAMLLFIMILGVISYCQANKIHQQTENIYSHPLKVRSAIGKLQADILEMRLGSRDLMLAKNTDEQQDAIMQMKIAEADATKQFEVLKTNYIGSSAVVDSAYYNFLSWKIAREENTKLALSGEIEKVKESIKIDGKVGLYREKMIKYLNEIDQLAQQDAVALFAESNKISRKLNKDLIVMVLIMLVLSIVIVSILLLNLRLPIKDLTNIATRFNEGDLGVRSKLSLKNEFGELASSFNSMVEKIQQDVELADKIESLTNAMLAVDNSHKFFRELLPELARLTNSQIAAVYLLSEDKAQFVHYESVGMSADVINHSFSSTSLHGEFGAVLSSREIEHIKSIPLDTKFVFQTVSGEIIPREIITIPILASGEVVAIISIASIRKYDDKSNELINKVFDILTARVEGILTYRKMRKFSKQLEIQNVELEIQGREMEQQSSELSEQNRELEVQKNQLHEASRLKTNFLSNMSHELRTPLNSVIALSGVLSRRLATKIPGEEYSFLEVIERNGKHLLSLINDILDISRIEAGREEIEISRFNPNNLLGDIVCMINQQAVQNNIELKQHVIEEDLQMLSDADKCGHILQNLVANAIKFTEAGCVEVSVSKNDDTVKFVVSDTGIGISEQNIKHIFDDFRQADGSTSRRFGGTGLGLAIAKRYAILLGGDIVVESRLGEGSVFTLSLPVTYIAASVVDDTRLPSILNKSDYQAPTISIHRKTILVVEDSEPAIIQMKDFIEDSGYNVLVARDGATAISMARESLPDGIILDLMMPGVDGFQVLQNLRDTENTALIPVLILTAKHITKKDMAALQRNNIYQLIQKGDINRKELLNAVDNMVSLVPAAEVVELKQDVDKQPRTNEKPRVLVVEDNPDNMITVKAVLENKFSVLEALDGYAGITMAQVHKPDLILMDIALPGLDGIEAFKTIRKNPELQSIPIVALTASAMTSDREIILAHGFDAYLVKPIDEELFFRTINEVLYGK